MARIQERQANWTRKARETSEASVSASASASSTGGSPSNTDRAAANPPASSASTAPAPTASTAPANTKSSAGPARTQKTKPSRKKVAKACLACQKSHLTCDECRPCTRCMKKGIGDQCVEGVRKKAKYLMEGDERVAPPAAPAPIAPQQQQQQPQQPQSQPQPAIQPNIPLSTSPPAPATVFNPNIPVTMLPGVVAGPPQTNEPVRVPDNIWLTAPLPEVQTNTNTLTDWSIPSDPFNFSASAAANLEYEMFDSMFGSLSPSFPLGDLGNTTDQSTPSMWNFGLDSNNNNPPAAQGGNDAILLTPQDTTSVMQPMLAADLSPQQLYSGNNWTQDILNDLAAPAAPEKPKKLTPEEVYASVVKPYDYTEGYHVLMQYLTQNFQKDEILRVVRALAAFRPSLIALQMPLSEEDEIFLERSFQRTLIELEKLISFSATPTVVWRRTGEIVCVAPEFCALVGKTEEEILRNRTCIYQMFSKQGTIDYWENYSVHAFENTTQNFFQATALETDKGTIPCAACFTIRRDVFDLPSAIIGQFLPIPAEAM